MTDRFVTTVVLWPDALVGLEVVGDEPRLRVYYFPNRILQRLPSHVRHNATANLTLPFDSRKHRSLACATSTLTDSLVARLSAYVGLIALNSARKFGSCLYIWCHRKANPVHKEQCRLVAYLAVPLNFQS